MIPHPVLAPISTSVSHGADSCLQPSALISSRQNVCGSFRTIPFRLHSSCARPWRACPVVALTIWLGSLPPSLLITPSPSLPNSSYFHGGYWFIDSPSNDPFSQTYPWFHICEWSLRIHTLPGMYLADYGLCTLFLKGINLRHTNTVAFNVPA